MNIKINNSKLTAKSVLGGTELYQNARRGYLEFIFDRAEQTVEYLDTLFAEGTAEITLTNEETEESFIYSGYVVRGPIRVYPTEGEEWEIAVRQYQRTEVETRLAVLESLEERLAALEGALK